MNELMTDFLDRINSLRPCTEPGHLADAFTGWSSHADTAEVRRALSDWLLGDPALAALSAAARETPTHYVWPVYAGTAGHSVVINEYKDPRHMGDGYATILHNHRYSFATFMLSGGYTQVRCDVQLPASAHPVRVTEIGEDALTEGGTVTVDHDAFHRLADIGARTMTILVKCPAVKAFSISVDARTLMVSKHVPVEARVLQLMDALTADVSGQARGAKHVRLA
jgi:hypothetical protein